MECSRGQRGAPVTGCRIEWSATGNPPWRAFAADTGNASTSSSHTRLRPGTTRYYRIAAINSAGPGARSNVAYATTSTVPPRAPTSLVATVRGSSRIDLAWNAPADTGGAVRTRRWSFGDGHEGRSGVVDRAWDEPGFYMVSLTVGDGGGESTASRTFLVEASDPAGTCVADRETLCLRHSRFAVRVDWWTLEGGAGSGTVVREGTDASGMFWFFGETNWETLIKVLDGCALNGHVWVFGASTTNLGYAIRVTDTATGAVREYRNEPGAPAPAITDIATFPAGCEP